MEDHPAEQLQTATEHRQTPTRQPGWLVVTAGVLVLAALVGVVVDRAILDRVAHGSPQRLAAATAGLFAGGLVAFFGVLFGVIFGRDKTRM